MTLPLSATVSIDPHRGCRRYDRMIFGQFLEHFHRQVYGGVFEPGSPLSDDMGFRLDVVEALRELRVPVVRWPGGCFVSAYHWKHGVGPDRRPSYDKAWRVEEPNTFGTDEFVAWCGLLGAEPFICTNAGTGTAEEMSDWVEYCNLRSEGRWAQLRHANGYAEPHHVQYWSIGNENYLSGEMGAKTIAEWGPLVREAAKMMKRADPSIKLLAAAVPDLDWTLSLLRHAGEHLDYVSIHGYWDRLSQQNNPSDYATCIARSGQPEDKIRITEQIIAVAGFEGRIGIAFDEWNLRGWHHPHPSENSRQGVDQAVAARDRNDINATYTMADAVFSAGFLNACMKHSKMVHMANMSPVVNTRGPLFVHPEGIVKRTTYHVMAMYANLFSENVVDPWVASDPFVHAEASVPALDAVATCDDAMHRWKLALVNRHPQQELSCTVVLGGRRLDGAYRATLLCGDSPDAYNDIADPRRVAPMQRELTFTDGVAALAPHSVTVLEFD